jgi:hypothetical protein
VYSTIGKIFQDDNLIVADSHSFEWYISVEILSHQTFIQLFISKYSSEFGFNSSSHQNCSNSSDLISSIIFAAILILLGFQVWIRESAISLVIPIFPGIFHSLHQTNIAAQKNNHNIFFICIYNIKK